MPPAWWKKWHLGYAGEANYHPQNHGFDYFMGYHSGNVRLHQPLGRSHEARLVARAQGDPGKGYTTHLINKYALEFLEQNKDKPFCLYVAHESPHSPVQGPNDPIQRGLGARNVLPLRRGHEANDPRDGQGGRAGPGQVGGTWTREEHFVSLFPTMEMPRGPNTGHPSHRGHKGSVYEGGTRVPAIAWWPGRIKPGTSTDALSITLDVMPTILSVAGIEKPKNRALDGVDLSPVLFEQKTLPARPLYWGSCFPTTAPASEALRDGNWKLVVQHPKAKPGTFANERIELFRLDKDLGEEDNLAEKEPKRAAAMFKQLKAWYAESRKPPLCRAAGCSIASKQRFLLQRQGPDRLVGFGDEVLVGQGRKIVMGHSAVKVPGNKFIWADGEVEDFYLTVEVKLTPDNRNAGIQFRSKKANASGQAFGYQAGVGGEGLGQALPRAWAGQAGLEQQRSWSGQAR